MAEDRVKLTSNGDFEFQSSDSVEESTEAEVETDVDIPETDQVIIWGEDAIQIFDVEIDKDDLILGLLLLNIGLQAGDFLND